MNHLKGLLFFKYTHNNMSLDIDTEWEQYLNNPNDRQSEINNINHHLSTILDNNVNEYDNNNSIIENESIIEETPKCSELNISTQTKVLFLSQDIDIYEIFWKIPVMPYSSTCDGIIKKQIKIVSDTPEQFNEMQSKLKNEKYYIEKIIKQIDNPTARRIKYKDERKITVGLSKKDIINTKGKQKNAFYNCFALYIRFKYNEVYKEIHVKVFNTGKLEIPGVADVTMLNVIKTQILNILQPHLDNVISFKSGIVENNDNSGVLINSGFNCNYQIDREKILRLLKSDKYQIESVFEPCSYPGVICKYYYNNYISETEQTGYIEESDRHVKIDDLLDSDKYKKVSIMLFGTGNALIVGNMNETILNHVYNFIVNILESNYKLICSKSLKEEKKIKHKKLRSLKIIVSDDYLRNNIIP